MFIKLKSSAMSEKIKGAWPTFRPTCLDCPFFAGDSYNFFFFSYDKKFTVDIPENG